LNVTMSDIAARAGTSSAVVSVILNGAKSKTVRVSERTRQLVLEAASELGYRRDPRAGALATGKNRVIGLMLPYASLFIEPDPFSTLVAAGVARCAAELGYNVMHYTAVAEEDGVRAAEMIDRRIDGLILIIPPGDSPIFQECERRGVATVAVLTDPQIAPLTVNSSDYDGGRIATEHLISLGHRRIAHLYGAANVHTSAIRQRAFEDAMQSAGLMVDPELVKAGRFSRGVSHDSTSQLFQLPEERRPTAIFACNDLSAHGAMDALFELGLGVPEDVSVVGFDDTWYALITNPPLTTVNMSVAEIGHRAAQVLIETVEGRVREQHSILPVSLTVRRSTGPVPVAELK
jgi:LacI family transcriptional regulator